MKNRLLLYTLIYMKIKLKTGQTPNDDLTLVKDNTSVNVFDKISTLSTKTFSAATITIQDTEGTPSGTATINNNTLAMQFTALKGDDGDKGIQGPDGIVGNTATYSSNVQTTFELVNTTGDSTTKAMTQKSVTDLFNNINIDMLDVIIGAKYLVNVYGDNINLYPHYIVDAGGNLQLTNIPSFNYAIDDIEILMGETDITSTAYNNGTITLTNVTNNVNITISVILQN